MVSVAEKVARTEEAALKEIYKQIRKEQKAAGCSRAIMVAHNANFDHLGCVVYESRLIYALLSSLVVELTRWTEHILPRLGGWPFDFDFKKRFIRFASWRVSLTMASRYQL